MLPALLLIKTETTRLLNTFDVFAKRQNEAKIISQYVLGLFYYNGDGIPRDYEEAAKWFRRAADQGYDMPQFMLAKLYASGRGVPKNIVVSQMWLTLSAAQGNEHAMKARDLLEERMTSGQIAEAQKLVREWKPKPER